MTLLTARLDHTWTVALWRRSTHGLWLVGLSLMLWIGVAQAAKVDLADLHYKRALSAYQGKEYARAIREFQAAYKVRQVPKILIDIGQVYRKLGMASTALRFYEHYLRVQPNPPADVRKDVERYIMLTQAMLEPPEFDPLPVVQSNTPKGRRARKMTPEEAAAAAVATAPSNVTQVTVPELYLEEGAASAAGSPASTAMHPVAPSSKPNGTWAPLPPTPPGAGSGTAAPGANLVQDARAQPAAQTTPVWKKPWFWGVIGGATAVVAIGVAIGASQSRRLPPDVLMPVK